MIKVHEDAGIKHVNNPNAFIERSNTMDDIYENINDYIPNRDKKVLTVLVLMTWLEILGKIKNYKPQL